MGLPLMYENMSVDLPPKPYLSGLLDSLGRMRFNIKRHNDDTFSTRPTLRIRTKGNDYIVSIIGEFLEYHDIDFSLFTRDRGFDYFDIHHRTDLESLHSYLEGHSTQLVRELAFTHGPYKQLFDVVVLSPTDTYRLLCAVKELQDRLKWGPKDSTPHPDEVAAEFNLNPSQIDRVNLPIGEFREDYPVEYIGGIFDGLAYFRPAIGKTGYSIGYYMTPVIRLNRGGVHPAFATAIKQFCDESGIRCASHGNINNLQVAISGPTAIEEFAATVGPYVIAKREELAYLHEQLIPRFRSKEHLERQGFYELVVAFEPIAHGKAAREKERKFTPEFFEEEWKDAIEPVDWERTREN